MKVTKNNCILPPLLMIFNLNGLVLLLGATTLGRSLATPNTLQNILDNTHQSPLYKYPTDLTREIVPVCTLPPLLVLPVVPQVRGFETSLE